MPTDALTRQSALAVRRLQVLAEDVRRVERSLPALAATEQAVETAVALSELLAAVAPVADRLSIRVRHCARTSAGTGGRQSLQALAEALTDIAGVVVGLVEDLDATSHYERGRDNCEH